MTVETPFILFLFLAVRILIPVGLLFLAGYLYERFIVTRREKADKRVAEVSSESTSTSIAPQPINTGIKPYAANQPCWNWKHCSAECRAECPAAQRPGLPCWLTMQLVQGQIPEVCFECSVFISTSQTSETVHLAR